MKHSKIFQVQGNKNAHYVNAETKAEAILTAKSIFPSEFIDFASDVTNSHFSEDEKQNLPEYILICE